MTDYDRGFLAGQLAMRERAANMAKSHSLVGQMLADRIRSLQPEGADQRGAAQAQRQEDVGSLETAGQLASAPHHNPGGQVPVAWTTALAIECVHTAMQRGMTPLAFDVSPVNLWGEMGVPLYAGVARPGPDVVTVPKDAEQAAPTPRTVDEIVRQHRPLAGSIDAEEERERLQAQLDELKAKYVDLHIALGVAEQENKHWRESQK